tara:strand:+ start:87 stop:626 length:540 start_codon:yes stop_codon:yes gene_type:complete
VNLSESEYSKLKRISNHICDNSLADDLLHETLEILIKYDKDKIESIINTGRLFFFGARIMTNLYHSKTSPFYYKYKKASVEYNDDYDTNFDKIILTDDDDNSLREKRLLIVEEILSEMYWYDRELFLLYFYGDNDGKKFTYTSMSEKLGISRRSIFYTIKQVKEHIKLKTDEIERANQV